MEINDNPFASPRAEVDTRFVAVEVESVGRISRRSIETLRNTKPWVLLLGVMGMIFGVVTIVAAGITLVSMGPRDQPSQQIAELAGNLVGAVVYIGVATMFLGYSRQIKFFLAAPGEESMIAALNAHRMLLKVMAITAVIMLAMYLLFLVGAILLVVA